MNKFKFYVMLAMPPLTMLSKYLAEKDKDTIGIDDEIAKLIDHLIVRLNEYMG